jgi:hypothetical protein
VVEFAMIGALFFALLLVLGVVFIEVLTWNEWHYGTLTGARAGSAPNASQSITEAATAAAIRTVYKGETIVACTPPWPGGAAGSSLCPTASSVPSSWSTNSPNCSSTPNPTQCEETNPQNALSLCPPLNSNIPKGDILICVPPDTLACGPNATLVCSPDASISSNGTDSVLVEGWIKSLIPNPFTGNSYLPSRAVDTQVLQEVQCDAASGTCTH